MPKRKTQPAFTPVREESSYEQLASLEAQREDLTRCRLELDHALDEVEKAIQAIHTEEKFEELALMQREARRKHKQGSRALSALIIVPFGACVKRIYRAAAFPSEFLLRACVIF